MILQVQDPGWDFTSLFIVVPILAVVIAVTVIITVKKGDEMDENTLFGTWSGVAIAVLIVFCVGGIGTGSKVYNEKIEDAQASGLEELGFSDVEMISPETFTATREGAHFDGLLIKQDAHLSWQVAEVLPPVLLEK